MQVYKEPCKNCLLSKDRIVSPERMKEIIKGCIQKQTHFVCHKASMNGENVCCKTFFDKLGQHSQLVRISERLNMIEFVDQPDSEKLITHAEMEALSTKKNK